MNRCVWIAAASMALASCGGDSRADLLAPKPNTTLPGSTVTFQWTSPNTGSRMEFWLDVGNREGQGDIYAGHQGSQTKRTVSNIPVDGRTIFVRLWTFMDGNRVPPHDYTFRAARR